MRDRLPVEPAPTPSEKLRTALDLADYGIRLQRAVLRRRHPEAPDEEVELLLQRWLLGTR